MIKGGKPGQPDACMEGSFVLVLGEVDEKACCTRRAAEQRPAAAG